MQITNGAGPMSTLETFETSCVGNNDNEQLLDVDLTSLIKIKKKIH